MKILMLTKENFYDHVEKESPISFKKFSDYIDDFKKSTNWNQLFNGIPNNGVATSIYVPKFHDIPFAMQKGIIENFFVLDNIQFYAVIHPFNEKTWTFHTIDTATGHIWSQFTNNEHKELAHYITSEDAEIAAIRMAFQVLNDNLTTNLN